MVLNLFMTMATEIKIVLSGPGSGKTTGMINEVVSKLPFLKPNCYIAVITYTNAATENIRLELSRKLLIPSNLFIGTIHSFINRFIVIPYASLFEICPSEMCFIENIDCKPEWRNFNNKKARDKGVISYDQIEWIAEKILYGGTFRRDDLQIRIKKESGNAVSKVISYRLQGIFVDEYQDATITQHKIFKKIILTGYTEYFYCVGDSEQYIYGFTYGKKGKKQPNFTAIPIKEFERAKNVIPKIIKDNYRSSFEIVEFLNKFSNIKQTPCTSFTKKIPVFYIKETNVNKIILSFRKLCGLYGLGNYKKFFLAYSQKTLNPMKSNSVYGITNNVIRHNLILLEILRYISGVLGVSQKKICEIKSIDQFEFRKIGFKILELIKKQPDIIQSEINNNIISMLGMKILKNHKCEDMLERIKNSYIGSEQNGKDCFTTIHKAKGLEACSVLVIAETAKKLENWLEVNKDVRENDNSDQCRIGFVAYSRAKQLLCLSCCEDFKYLKERINMLGIKII